MSKFVKRVAVPSSFSACANPFFLSLLTFFWLSLLVSQLGVRAQAQEAMTPGGGVASDESSSRSESAAPVAPDAVAPALAVASSAGNQNGIAWKDLFAS